MKNNRKNRKSLALICKAEMLRYPFDKPRQLALMKLIKVYTLSPENRGYAAKWLIISNGRITRLMGWRLKNGLLQPSGKILGPPPLVLTTFECLDKATDSFKRFGHALNQFLDVDFKVGSGFGASIAVHLFPENL